MRHPLLGLVAPRSPVLRPGSCPGLRVLPPWSRGLRSRRPRPFQLLALVLQGFRGLDPGQHGPGLRRRLCPPRPLAFLPAPARRRLPHPGLRAAVGGPGVLQVHGLPGLSLGPPRVHRERGSARSSRSPTGTGVYGIVLPPGLVRRCPWRRSPSAAGPDGRGTRAPASPRRTIRVPSGPPASRPFRSLRRPCRPTVGTAGPWESAISP
ncbi:MAG: hypothetical protein MZU97_07990 [Bacillus subtilis]|nr:hypothetical protein [Bacillus subtilis]